MSDQNHQMRPIARNLKPPPLPKFVEQKVEIHQYESNVIQFNTKLKVKISCYENGPFGFHVQFCDSENELKNFQNQLTRIELKNFNFLPSTIGFPCLVRHDRKIFRAAVQKLPSQSTSSAQNYIVSLVDYGFLVSIEVKNMFQIPNEFLRPKFAVPLKLFGVNDGLKVSAKEVSVIFKHLTENRVVNIKCVKSEAQNFNNCEMFLEDGINVLEKLRKWDPYNVKYRPQKKLENQSTLDVKVCYVESPSEFFVHIQNPKIIDDYDATCDELYKAIPLLTIMENPKPGCCCAILLTNELYRGVVVSLSNDKVKVRIVDYGIVEEVHTKNVFLLPEHLTEKAPFAYRCCLVGFDPKVPTSENISTQFDIFCGDGRGDRKIFKFIVEKFDGIYYVNLDDVTVTPSVNVNKMLLKNSRPLLETIQLENAMKRQKDGKDNNNPKREKNQQNSTSNTQNDSKSHRSFFGKQSEDNKTNNNKTKGNESRKTKAQQKKEKSSDLKFGWVSTLESINHGFVHYDEHIEGLEKILDEMFTFYENKHTRKLMNDIKIGDVCAVRSSDSNWYRSKIDSINGDKIKVIHCEYGNVETVHKSKLRVLDDKFAKINDLVINAYFAIKTNNNEKSLLNEMRKIFDDGAKEFSFKIIERFQDGFILEPIEISDGKNIIDELVKSGKAERINVGQLMNKLKPRKSVEPEKKPNNDRKNDKKSPEKSEKQKKPRNTEKSEMKKIEIPIKINQNNNEMKVKLTALSSSTDFYVMRIEDVINFQKLQADIQIISSSSSKLTSFDENTLCLAKQPYDLQWYRSKIIDSDDNMITVRCLDDGKTFSVEDRNLLLKMPNALEERKFFSISCKLPVQVDKKSDEIVTELLLQKVESEFIIKYLWKNSEMNFVDLINENDESIVDILVSKNLAEKFEFLNEEKAFTSHINSTSSFFLQLESDQLKLDLISKFFEDSKGNFEHFDVKIGDIVAALYPEDESWYRSRIDKIYDNKRYLVTFIDFGNSCEVEKIGKIQESTIENLPKMSKHCSLFIPTTNSIEISETKFQEICDNGATILNVKMIEPGIPTKVEIYIDGKNIFELLTK